MAVSIIICYGGTSTGKSTWAKMKGIEHIDIEYLHDNGLNNLINRIKFFIQEDIDRIYTLEYNDLNDKTFELVSKIVTKLESIGCAVSYRHFERNIETDKV